MMTQPRERLRTPRKGLSPTARVAVAVSALIFSSAGARRSSGRDTFRFKAQVLHDRLGPMKRFSISVDGKPTVTDDGGVLEVPLAAGTTHVVVALSGGAYTIHYPYGGFVAVPRDLNDMPQIIVGNPKENDYLKQYLGLYQLLKKGAVPAGELQALNGKMSALQNLLLQLHYSDADLRTAKQVQDGKDDYFPEISSDLVDFKTRAVDLKTAFKYTAEFAFENAQALQRLQEAVLTYNYALNKLNKQHLNYEKRIADFWQNDQTLSDFRQLTELVLIKINRDRIYPMQAVIGQINQYFRGDRSKDLKRQIQDSIADRVKNLGPLLQQLETLTDNFLGELSR